MDFLSGHERKYSDDDEAPDMTDVLGADVDAFATSTSMGDDSFLNLSSHLTENDHNDWFNSIFDEQGLVYNDRNLGEAATQPPCIKSEHSYSVSNLRPSSPFGLIRMEETDDHSSNLALDLTHKSRLTHAAATATQPICFKMEPPETDPFLMAMTSTTAPATTLTHTANIFLTSMCSSVAAASTTHHSSQVVFPTSSSPTSTATIQIKTEPEDTYEMLQEQTVSMDSMILPPTPPSSNGSDSDESQSPQRSAPSSPQHQSPVRVYHYHHFTQALSPDRSSSAAQTLSQPLFLSPVPQSGLLILTEEEKRTLISEGYPIPSKLPLTKQEEKNLKKVRRKIKNKISAQESRRKKKEYVEALEKRVEAYNHENSDLKKKLESLENNNRSLLGQLHKLQALVAKVPKSVAAAM